VAGLPLAVNGRVQRRCIRRLRGHATAAAHTAAERDRGALLAATSMARKAAMRSEQPAGLAAPSQPQGSRACSRPGHYELSSSQSSLRARGKGPGGGGGGGGDGPPPPPPPAPFTARLTRSQRGLAMELGSATASDAAGLGSGVT